MNSWENRYPFVLASYQRRRGTCATTLCDSTDPHLLPRPHNPVARDRTNTLLPLPRLLVTAEIVYPEWAFTSMKDATQLDDNSFMITAECPVYRTSLMTIL